MAAGHVYLVNEDMSEMAAIPGEALWLTSDGVGWVCVHITCLT